MRRHAWNIFAGLTFNTASGVPVFRTWYTKLDLFPGLDASRAEALGGFGFEFPRQFLPLKASGSTANTNVAGTMPVLDKVYYNQTLYEFAVKAQLNCGSVKTDLNKGFDPHNGVGGAQIEDRHIAAFPRDSIAIKTAWWAVAANALTPLPVWDPESNSMADGGNASNGRDGAAWSRYVAVDSRGGGSHAGGVIQALAGGVLQTMRVVSLRRF
jgi:hypothetical protein